MTDRLLGGFFVSMKIRRIANCSRCPRVILLEPVAMGLQVSLLNLSQLDLLVSP